MGVIAFAARYDSCDASQWSGTPASMALALERTAGEPLLRIGPLHDRWRNLHRARAVVHRGAIRGYLRDREPSLLRAWGAQVERAARSGEATVVVSPSSLPVAYMPGRRPVAVWTDATFASMVASNPRFSRLTRRQLRDGHDAELRMFDRASVVAYSSEWARRSAIEAYGADPGRVHVLGFGPNFGELPNERVVARAIRARAPEPLRLLLVGVDWNGKGGDIATAVASELEARGVPTVLDVVGMVPPRRTRVPDNVHVHGFLRKSDPQQASQLATLLRGAHLSILPTRHDCTPVALIEAAAHGVPCIAPAVGGLRDVVADGQSGLLVPPDAPPDAYVERILEYRLEPEALTALAHGARQHQQRQLHWDVSTRRLLELLEPALAPGTPA